jgi:hypothetical protein
MYRYIQRLFGSLALLVAMPAAALNGFDLSNSLVDRHAIEFGGQPRDGIPALDAPYFVEAQAAQHVLADDPVLGIAAFGASKTYPIKILAWHEIVNDTIGGIPIVVSYCPLCASGVAFVAEANGAPLTFGVSGLLYNSNLLLYDRETESLWSQLSWRAISGPMAGTRLRPVPVTHTRWEDWRREHPGGAVLSDETGFYRPYDVDPYEGYEQSQALLFSVSPTSDRYRNKERVLGININGQAKAYPLTELRAAGVELLLDRFAGRDILIHFDPFAGSARAYAANGVELPTTLAYWFAWFSFYPGTAVYEAPGHDR